MEEFSREFQYLLLILARIIGLFATAPVFSAQGVSFRTRIILALFIAIVLQPTVSGHMPPLPSGPGAFAFMLFGQATIGIVIGFMLLVIFTAFQLAGQIFSIQMGISFSEVLDPGADVSVPVLGTLKNTLGLLLFLTVDFRVDGLHVPAYMHMIRAMADSFIMAPTLIPDGQVLRGIFIYVDKSLGVMFITALKLGIPIMGILFISSVMLGLLGRAAPQMNLMNMGIQLNIIIGTFVLFTLLPVIVPIMQDAFHRSFITMGEMFRDWPKN